MKKLILPLIFVLGLGLNCNRNEKLEELKEVRTIINRFEVLKKGGRIINSNYSDEFAIGAHFLIFGEEPDSAIKYFEKDLELIEKFNKKHGRKAENFLSLAKAYSMKKDFDYSFIYLTFALEEFEGIDHNEAERGKADCYYQYALNFELNKDYEAAVDYLKKAAFIREDLRNKIKKNLDDLMELSIIYKKIGDIMKFEKTEENRFNYYDKSSELHDIVNKKLGFPWKGPE
jgi:tetratricopeptide (TPR) repeat protein